MKVDDNAEEDSTNDIKSDRDQIDPNDENRIILNDENNDSSSIQINK